MEATDPSSGNTYYYNRETKESSWEQPTSNKESALSKYTEGEDNPGPSLGTEQVKANGFPLREQNPKEDKSSDPDSVPSGEISRDIDPNPGDIHSNQTISSGLDSLGAKEVEGPANNGEEDISAISTNDTERRWELHNKYLLMIRCSIGQLLV